MTNYLLLLYNGKVKNTFELREVKRLIYYDGYGIKELYDISLRLNNPVEILGKKYDMNEIVLYFKTAELSQIQESKKEVAATGGYHNNQLINWEIDKDITFSLTHGILTPVSWAMLSNSKVESVKEKSIPFQETLKTIEDDQYCFVDLMYCPNSFQGQMGIQGNPNNEPLPMGRRPELMLKPLPPSKTKYIFCYDVETGQRIRDFKFYNNRVFFERPYRKVLIDYTFTFKGEEIKTIEVGNRLFNNYLRLDAKFNAKNENSGEVSTGIIEIPKLKLSSSLSMRLGKDANEAVVSDFYFVGYPDENIRREKQKVCSITFLDRDITKEYI